MSGQIDSIVTVNITATSAQPTRGNFGTPLFLQYHTHNVDLVRTYTQASDLVTDGYTVNDPAYLWATKVTSQDPHPPTFKIGRGSTAVAQTFTLTITDNTNGDSVGITVTSPLGVTADCHVTVSSQTLAQVATAVAALIDALPDIAATASGAVITATVGTAGNIWYPSLIKGGTYADTTTTSAPGTDLDAIRLVDDDWYGVTGAIMSAADIQAVAVWTAANKKVHCYTSADSANLAAASGIMHTLKVASYKRSYGQFSGQPIEYGASALEAQRFTVPPGTDTWAFKNLEGVTIDNLTPTQRTNITGNNGNYYVDIGGVSSTFDGRSAQGQFMDLTRFLDALSNDIQIRVFTLIANSEKVPYDSIGIAAIGGEVRASLSSFVRTGALSNDVGFQPQVQLPNIADVSTGDKQARILNGVTFSCTYTDAIHSVVINGTVSL